MIRSSSPVGSRALDGLGCNSFKRRPGVERLAGKVFAGVDALNAVVEGCVVKPSGHIFFPCEKKRMNKSNENNRIRSGYFEVSGDLQSIILFIST